MGKHIMIDFIINVIVYLIVQTILLAVAVGIAFVLHGCIPGLDIGMALLVSTLSSIACAYLMTRAFHERHMGLLEDLIKSQADGDVDDDDDTPSAEMHLAVGPSSKKRRRPSKGQRD
jgi:hypothetical protein